MTALSPQEVIPYPFPFSVGPRKVIGALCEDGTQRTATCSAQGADTFFSIPARVSARGKTVSGYVTTESSWCVRCNRASHDHEYKRPDGSYDFSAGHCPDGAPAEFASDVYLFRAYRYGKNAGAILDHVAGERPAK